MRTISIITICFNNLSELIATSKSVDNQLQKPFEHIIIDGSTTNEIKYYLENNPQPLFRKWLYERDKGIADAFNKGIRLSAGKVLVMLNSADTLFDKHALQTVTKTFAENSSAKWLHGKYQLERGNQKVIIGKPFEKNKLYRGMRSICHQTMFIKKELHDLYGYYDTNEKIGMDYDFLCRIADEPFVFINKPLVSYAPAGISSTSYIQSLKDAKRIYEKHYGKNILLNLWQFRLMTLHYLLKSPVGNFLYKIKTKLKLENM